MRVHRGAYARVTDIDGRERWEWVGIEVLGEGAMVRFVRDDGSSETFGGPELRAALRLQDEERAA